MCDCEFDPEFGSESFDRKETYKKINKFANYILLLINRDIKGKYSYSFDFIFDIVLDLEIKRHNKLGVKFDGASLEWDKSKAPQAYYRKLRKNIKMAVMETFNAKSE